MNKESKIIEVHVKSNSKQRKIKKVNGNKYEIWVKSKAKRGKANKELVKLLADYFKMNQNQIKIVKGVKSRNKIIKIIE